MPLWQCSNAQMLNTTCDKRSNAQMHKCKNPQMPNPPVAMLKWSNAQMLNTTCDKGSNVHKCRMLMRLVHNRRMRTCVQQSHKRIFPKCKMQRCIRRMSNASNVSLHHCTTGNSYMSMTRAKCSFDLIWLCSGCGLVVVASKLFPALWLHTSTGR